MRNKIPIHTLAVPLLLVFLSTLAAPAAAQTSGPPLHINTRRPVVASLQVTRIDAHGELRVELGDGWDAPADARSLKVQLRFMPSGTAVSPSAVLGLRYAEGGRTALLVKLARGVWPPRGDDRIEVRVEPVADWKETPQDSEMAAREAEAAAVASRSTQVRSQAERELRRIAASEKMTEEKYLFAALNLSDIARGDGEIHVNRNVWDTSVLKSRLFNQIKFVLHFDTTSGDTRALNAGLDFRKFFLRGGLKRAIRESGVGGRGGLLNFNRSAAIVEDHQDDFVRELLLDPFAPHLEMDMQGLRPGPVANFTSTSTLQVRTRARGITKRLWWSYRIVPVGFEGGFNLRNTENEAREREPIARLYTAGTLKLFMASPCRDDLLFSGLDFEATALNRHLFVEESLFNRATKLADQSVKGNRYAIRLDLKYLFGPVIPRLRRRPALRITYKNGYFPPVYGFTNGIRFGVSLETSDNTNAREIDLH